MAKRFTDTDKWKKPLLKNIPMEYKLLWLYVCDDCDHAGIWDVDFDVAELRVGEQLSEEKATEYFNGKIILIDGGQKWFIPSFVEFQYGELNEKNRAHESVIKILKKHNLLNEKLSIYKEISPLQAPYVGAKDKVKDKEQDKDKDFGKSENLLPDPELVVPAMEKIFIQKNKKYQSARHKDYPALLQIATELNGEPLRDLSDCDKLKTRWGEIADFIANDDFFKNYSLAQISKHLQAILLKKDNEIDSRRTAKGGKTISGRYQPEGTGGY
jgi:hypothetical protein